MSESQRTEKRLACRWWHRWTAWEDAFKGTQYYGDKGPLNIGIPVVVQERRCTKCNELEQRTVHP